MSILFWNISSKLSLYLSIISDSKGLVAFVSGGASGLGRATVNRLAKKGAKVVFCDLPSSDGAAVASKIGENATFIPADITKDQDVSNVMNEIRKKHGKLNVVVNCAGLGNAHTIYNFTADRPRNQKDFEKILEVCRLFIAFKSMRRISSKQFVCIFYLS